MTVTSLTPLSALPGSSGNAQLANSNPLLGAGQMPVSGAVGAANAGAMGVAEKPSIGARLMNAMKAAIAELRGGSPQQPQPSAAGSMPAGQAIVASPQTMAAMAGEQAPLAVAASGTAATPVKHLKASSLTAKQKAAVKARVAKQAQAEKSAAAKVGAQTGAVGAVGAVGAAGMAGAAGAPIGATAGLPANATQLPGATVYSYDGNGNPAVAGLQGLPANMQQQLGVLPQFGNQVDAMTGMPVTTAPQTNQTNQTSIPTGAGVGLGMGTAVPVLGQPIANPPLAAPTTAGTQPAGPTTGGTQRVVNSNTNDQSSLNQNPGYGYGAGYGMAGGIGMPALPYGSSMTGFAPGQQGGISGFFSKLFG